MTSLDNRSIASHVIVALARAQSKGRAVRLDELATDLGVRRADVRGVVTRLHAEGHVDAVRLRLTLSGLALGVAFARCALPAARPQADNDMPMIRVA